MAVVHGAVVAENSWTHEVAFDTSALSEVVRNGMAGQIRQRILATKARLVVPIDTLVEMADSRSSSAGPVNRMWRLASLLRQLGENATVTMDLPSMVQSERRGRQPSSPALSLADANRILARFAEGRVERLTIGSYLDKETLRAVGDSVRNMMPEAGLDAAELDSARLFSSLRDFVLDGDEAWLHHIIPDRRWAGRVKRAPSQYPVTVLTSAAHGLQTLGVFSTPTRAIRPSPLFRLRPDPNDWIDARIIGQSAYASIFVTNDGHAARRVNFIRECFGFGPRAVSLRIWLSVDSGPRIKSWLRP